MSGTLDARRDPLGNHLVYADGLSDDLRYGKYMHLQRGQLSAINPLILQYGTQASPVGVPALPTAAADGIDTIVFPNAPFNSGIELHQVTAQTLMPLVHATKGIEIALDQVDNETVEYVPGGNHAANPFGCLVGTDPGILIEATFEITDASGMDQFGLLLRKQEAYVTPTSFLTTGDGLYTDFCLFGFAATKADPNPVNVSTDLNNSGSATVQAASFTWADTLVHKLTLELRGRRVRFFINGVELGGRVSKDALGASITAQQTVSGPGFSFDSGDFIIPAIFVRQDADVTPVYLRELLVAQLVSVGRANEQR